MENKLEKKNGSKVLIIGLSLIVFGLSAFIVYDKFLKEEPKPKETNEKEKKEEIIEKEDLDEIAQKLMDKLETYKVDYYDKKQNIDFQSADEKETAVGAYVYTQGKDGSMRQSIEDYYLNLFGKKLSNYPNIECHAGDGTLYKYDSNSNEYIKDCGITDSCHAHGGLCTNSSAFMNYNNIEKEGDNYIITVTKVYGPTQGMCYESPDNAFYADYTYTVKLNELKEFTKTDSNGNYGQPDIENAKKYYKQNYEKFKDIKPNYRYTFKKVDNDFYLIKLETV